ncbi:MAG: indole-3-glycerol phosphate synthase TrpC [Bacteroidaceae bacterium]|nr:indole-3-glycerol phosphate synthase TrpC [Bacteroidaceae bacterium]
MKDILKEIVESKRQEVEQHRQVCPMEYLADEVRKVMAIPLPHYSMSEALRKSATGIIAEFKRKSPSKGWIHESASPEVVIPAYLQAGATALSILTDGPYFGGNLKYIKQVRQEVSIPILRKDFIIDEYQLLEAKLVGADAVLLIATCLSLEDCINLINKAHEIELEVLLEVHNSEELAYIKGLPEMVGVNNRNLGSFVTDVQNSFRMADALQESVKGMDYHPVLVSESGISNPQTIRDLRDIGYRGFLIGETFMKTPHPAETLKHFIQEL